MKYLKYILPREALEKIYISRIRSMIEYGNVLYDNCPKCLSDSLESVQLDAARDPLLFVNIVLKGCNDVKADENVNIFKAFQHFIIESGRFK